MFGVDPGGSRRIEPAHVGRAAGVWVVTYKKRSGGPYASYDDVVEEALCFGWIDSVRRSLDADRSQLLVTPRKRGSRWFKANKQRIQRLTAAGRLAPAGLAAVTDAKADGAGRRWTPSRSWSSPRTWAPRSTPSRTPVPTGMASTIDQAGHPGMDHRCQTPPDAGQPGR